LIKTRRVSSQIEKRVETRLNKWQEDMEDELRRQREAALFKARPAAVLEQEPFVPKKSDKPLCEIDNVELHSDRRAMDREQYDMHRMKREADLEAMKRQVRLFFLILWFYSCMHNYKMIKN
jgi:hypothetical protein